MANKLAKTGHQSISHAELVSASSTQAVLPWKQQRQALKTLKQVQGDGTYFNNNGFTLIELLVVVLIIGILASVALPQYQIAVEKSRSATVWPLLKAINEAEQRKNMEEGTSGKTYPLSELDLGFENINTTNDGWVQHYISTSDFHIGLASRYVSDPSVTASEPAAAHRVGGSSSYILSLHNGKKTCAGGDICKKIVGRNIGTAWQDCLTGGTCFTD